MSNPSRSLRARRWASLLSAVAVSGAVGSASAQAWPDDGRGRGGGASEGGPIVVGARIGFGPAITGPADDPPEGPSLLYGTAFTGTALSFGGVFRYRLNPYAALRAELGLTRSQVTGFAEDETFRRELTFKMMTVGLPLLFEGGYDAGRVRFGAHLGIQPRFGATARAEEIRSGAVGNEPPLTIRTGMGMGLVLGGGLGVDVGRTTIPLEVRYTRNVLYPGTTADRFDNYESPEAPGAYLVETRWDLLVLVGFDLALPGSMQSREPSTPRSEPQREPRERRSRNEPTVTLPPAVVVPPTPPPAPPQPDQDGDSVPDRLDACPIEPANPSDNPSYPGCPPSGGIIQLSCERLFIGAPIDFESGSDVIQAGSYPLLYLLADTMELADNVRLVRIEGHTDDRGSAEVNRQLSEDRAYAVLTFLTDLGIDPARLEAVGYGEDYPVADNSTEQGRAENRRVEFHIVENTTCQW